MWDVGGGVHRVTVRGGESGYGRRRGGCLRWATLSAGEGLGVPMGRCVVRWAGCRVYWVGVSGVRHRGCRRQGSVKHWLTSSRWHRAGLELSGLGGVGGWDRWWFDVAKLCLTMPPSRRLDAWGARVALCLIRRGRDLRPCHPGAHHTWGRLLGTGCKQAVAPGGGGGVRVGRVVGGGVLVDWVVRGWEGVGVGGGRGGWVDGGWERAEERGAGDQFTVLFDRWVSFYIEMACGALGAKPVGRKPKKGLLFFCV